MRRLAYFWSGLSWSSRLQFLALAIFLGYRIAVIDLNPRNKILGLALWQVTIPLILVAITTARVLLPAMMRNPGLSERLLQGLGLLVFAAWILAAFMGPQIVLAYLAMTFVLWLDASCWFWFLSEIRMRQAVAIDQATRQSMTDEPEYSSVNDEEQ